MSKSRFRFYAVCFLFGSFADYYVRFWQRCYERPIPSIEFSSWLLAISQATDSLQYPVAIVRKALLTWVFMLPHRFPPLPSIVELPVVLLWWAALLIVLAAVPLVSALIYSCVLGAIERCFFRPRSQS